MEDNTEGQAMVFLVLQQISRLAKSKIYRGTVTFIRTNCNSTTTGKILVLPSTLPHGRPLNKKGTRKHGSLKMCLDVES